MRVNREQIRLILLIGFVVGVLQGESVFAWTVGDRISASLSASVNVLGRYEDYVYSEPATVWVDMNLEGDWVYGGAIGVLHPIRLEWVRVHVFNYEDESGYADFGCDGSSVGYWGSGSGSGQIVLWLDESTLNPVWVRCIGSTSWCEWDNGFMYGDMRIEIAFEPYLDELRDGLYSGMSWEQTPGIRVIGRVEVEDSEHQWWSRAYRERSDEPPGAFIVQPMHEYDACAAYPVVFATLVSNFETSSGWCPAGFFAHQSFENHSTGLSVNVSTSTHDLPTPTRAPHPTSTPTQPPDPSPAPSPSPSATPESCGNPGVSLVSTSTVIMPGIVWSLDIVVCNPAVEEESGLPLHVVLEYGGAYYFGPTFSQVYDSYLGVQSVFAPGETVVSIVDELEWPDGVGVGECLFYAVLMTADYAGIWGDWDQLEFRWMR